MKKKSSIIKVIMMTLTCITGVGILSLATINWFMIKSYDDKVFDLSGAKDKLSDADCILVLGAGVWANDRPSPMLKERLDRSLELVELGISDRLLMSGDHGRVEYDEVNVMKAYAIEHGLASELIFMDHAGFSTYESMVRAKEVFEVKKAVIVTQSYHMGRALYIANKIGIDAYGVISDEQEFSGQSYRNAREILARGKDFFSVLFGVEPTYLGEVIPISGSGEATND